MPAQTAGPPWLITTASGTAESGEHVCSYVPLQETGLCSTGYPTATAHCPVDSVEMPTGCFHCPAGQRVLGNKVAIEDGSNACHDCRGLTCAEPGQTTFTLPSLDATGLLQGGDRFFIEVQAYSSAVNSLWQARSDSQEIQVDFTPPLPGYVSHSHVNTSSSKSSSASQGHSKYILATQYLHAWWYDFKDPETEVISYRACVGTQAFLCNVQVMTLVTADDPATSSTNPSAKPGDKLDWNTSTPTRYSFDTTKWLAINPEFTMTDGKVYCVTVEATNAALVKSQPP